MCVCVYFFVAWSYHRCFYLSVFFPNRSLVCYPPDPATTTRMKITTTTTTNNNNRVGEKSTTTTHAALIRRQMTQGSVLGGPRGRVPWPVVTVCLLPSCLTSPRVLFRRRSCRSIASGTTVLYYYYSLPLHTVDNAVHVCVIIKRVRVKYHLLLCKNILLQQQ